MGERINAANFPIDGDIVQRLRNKLMMSPGALAVASGLSKGYISLIEGGKIEFISQAAASKLAEALGIKKELIQASSANTRQPTPQDRRRILLGMRADLIAMDRQIARMLDSADPKKTE